MYNTVGMYLVMGNAIEHVHIECQMNMDANIF